MMPLLNDSTVAGRSSASGESAFLKGGCRGWKRASARGVPELFPQSWSFRSRLSPVNFQSLRCEVVALEHGRSGPGGLPDRFGSDTE